MMPVPSESEVNPYWQDIPQPTQLKSSFRRGGTDNEYSWEWASDESRSMRSAMASLGLSIRSSNEIGDPVCGFLRI